MEMVAACSHLFAIVLVMRDGFVAYSKLLSPLSELNYPVAKGSWDVVA